MAELIQELIRTRDGAVTFVVLLVFLSPTVALAVLAIHWVRAMLRERPAPAPQLRPVPLMEQTPANDCVPRQEYNEMISAVRSEMRLMAAELHDAKERLARLEGRGME